MEFFKSNRYRSGVDLIIVADLVSECFGGVQVDAVPKQRGPELVFKKEFALAIVDVRHRRSCAQKRVSSGEPGTERAAQPAWTTLVAAPASLAVTDHELPRRSPPANVTKGLLLRDKSLIAVIKFFVQ